ncbi:MAG: hypothetical protein RLZZ129_756 [Verrucomicrobiota bacterium]|jgi:hypothetical protein
MEKETHEDVLREVGPAGIAALAEAWASMSRGPSGGLPARAYDKLPDGALSMPQNAGSHVRDGCCRGNRVAERRSTPTVGCAIYAPIT